jgi:hypothetical protein
VSVLILLCQGIIFEDANSFDGTYILIFTVVIFSMLLSTVILAFYYAISRISKLNMPILIPKPAIKQMSDELIREMYFLNSLNQLENNGVVELLAKDMEKNLSPLQLREVENINGALGDLVNEQFEDFAKTSRQMVETLGFRSTQDDILNMTTAKLNLRGIDILNQFEENEIRGPSNYGTSSIADNSTNIIGGIITDEIIHPGAQESRSDEIKDDHISRFTKTEKPIVPLANLAQAFMENLSIDLIHQYWYWVGKH